ncbi:hypothetical protein FOA43_000481 [Brettanomyces nanus]|uniref:Uncharacterized protein n=1 Tax=Eeniella nana TaxID=13502 RepID=A0A875RYP3_EENNA|nr:uncharacterized protein FOA43_000481 [Brettanomyces nanus]QPG73175.1 hypothetical protein FOA43_000481 [Brettanomyces nanus]
MVQSTDAKDEICGNSDTSESRLLPSLRKLKRPLDCGIPHESGYQEKANDIRSFSKGSNLEKGLYRVDESDSYREKHTHFRKLAKNWLFNSNVSEVVGNRQTESRGLFAQNEASEVTSESSRFRSSRKTSRRSGRHFLSEWFSEERRVSGTVVKKEDEFALKEQLLLSRLIEANLSNTESAQSKNTKTLKQLLPPTKALYFQALQNNEAVLNQVLPIANIFANNTELATSWTLLLTDIPKCTSLATILTQIGGGPLQSVQLLRRIDWNLITGLHNWNDCIDWGETNLRLQFDNHENAMKFYEHSRTGAFVVNGFHIVTQWVPNEFSKRKFNKGIANDIEKEVLEYMAEPEGARRVLVLKRPVPNKKKTATGVKKQFSYPNPLNNYTESFDVEAVIKDFSHFGKIVEVTPVISRKLSFGIQFFDVISAMAAKHSIEGNFENEDELKVEIAKKYSDWYVWYGKDPTDKPILE